MVDKYTFLTPEWMDAARAIRDQMSDHVGQPVQVVRMNQTITDAPFNGGADIEVHLDTSGLEFTIEEGHIDDPDVTITVDWFTARALLVEQDKEAAMSAFMTGRIDVRGDMMKIIAILAETPDPAARQIAAKIKDITADE